MGLATVFSRAGTGFDAPLVTVEINTGSGLPMFSVVGLPQAAVRESKDRVRAAIQNNHYEFPSGRITANLAPADLKKSGGRYDLPIAIGILVASGQVQAKNLLQYEFAGEFSSSPCANRDVIRFLTVSLPAVILTVRADAVKQIAALRELVFQWLAAETVRRNCVDEFR